MSAPRFLTTALLFALLPFPACAGSRTYEAPGHSAPGPRMVGSGVLIQGETLRAGGSGTVLEGMDGHVQGLQVLRRTGRCPFVLLRGVRTMTGSPNARVYVDGAPTLDTCILEQIRAREVAWIEVYPGGVAQRSGYRPDPNGLILIFRMGAAIP